MSQFTFVARFTAQGRVDRSFDDNGYVVHDVDKVDMDAPSVASSDYASHIVVDRRDRPVAITRSSAVFRLTPDGAPDTSFNGTGQLDLAPFRTTRRQFFLSLATDTRTRIYVT